MAVSALALLGPGNVDERGEGGDGGESGEPGLIIAGILQLRAVRRAAPAVVMSVFQNSPARPDLLDKDRWRSLKYKESMHNRTKSNENPLAGEP